MFIINRGEKSVKDSFQLQIVLIIFLTTLSLSISIYFLMYTQFHNVEIEGLKSSAREVNQYISSFFDKTSFSELDTIEDESKNIYSDAQMRLDEIRRIAGILYLYTAKQNEAGEYIYVVDGLASGSADFRHVGDLIEPEIIPELARSLNGEIVFGDDILKAEWGDVYVAYFPVYDEEGAVIGAIGMEFDCANLSAAITRVTTITIAVSLLIMAVFTGVAIFASKKVSEPFYKKLAYRDALTNLPNRMAFEENMKARHRRVRGLEDLAIVIYDLNSLKKVNDTFGHTAGDVYVKNSAKAISHALRPLGETYRIGGDEFATVIVGHSKDMIKAALRKLSESEEKVYKNTKLDCAFGMAFYNPALDKDPHDILRRADVKMYVDKRTKKSADDSTDDSLE